MLAENCYDGDDVRASLLLKGILPIIPPREQPDSGTGRKTYIYSGGVRSLRFTNLVRSGEKFSLGLTAIRTSRAQASGSAEFHR